MLNMQMSENEVALLGGLSTASALVSYFLFSVFRPKKGKYFSTHLISSLGTVIYPLCLLMSALFGGHLALAVILVGSASYELAAAFKGSSELAIVPHLFPRRQYGQLLGRGGSIACLLSSGISLIGAVFMKDTENNTGYLIFFSLSVLLLLISALMTSRYRSTDEAQDDAGSSNAGGVNFKQLFGYLKDRDFLWRMLPHLLRGVGMAGIYYYSLIGLKNAALNPTQSLYLILVGGMASLIGNLLLIKISQRITSGRLVLCTIIITVTCMLIIPFVNNVLTFFIVYFISSLSTGLHDGAIPMGVLRSTPTQELGVTSALRLMISNGVNCIMMIVFGLMVETQPFLTMAISSAIFLISAILYDIQFKDQMEEKE